LGLIGDRGLGLVTGDLFRARVEGRGNANGADNSDGKAGGKETAA
jgi:hypothetical protein